MKKTVRCLCFALLLLMMAMVWGMAAATDAFPAEVEALVQSVLPSHTILRSHQCGNTAAAVVSDGQTQTLCVAERNNGAWELVVCNAAALRQDTPVTSLYLDTDEALFWSYHSYGTVYDTYNASRSGADSQWRMNSLMQSETHDNGNITEAHLSYDGARLYYTTYFCDENENILSTRRYTPVPAAWLDEQMLLTAYDDSRFPKPNQYYTHSWLSDEATAKAAAELFPGDTYLGGCAQQDHLEFFLQQPNGERIIAVCTFDHADDWHITRSTPMPQGTTYGYENFSSSLVIGDLLVNVGPVDESTCGVTYIYNMADTASGETMFRLGKNWVAEGSPIGYENCFGDHPWANLSTVDWNSLPRTLEEALAGLDTDPWAVVNNPNPQDRLHLRTDPDRGATSLGKYYNGTPVRILATREEWVEVDIFGVTGWMMKEYLAFGDAGRQVEAVFPSRVYADTSRYHYVFAEPSSGQPIACYDSPQQDLLVLAVVGDEWYHVWFPEDDLTGYVYQSDWKEGNG